LGALAYQDKMRKHAMHAAVLVGLVGLLGAGVMSIRALSSGNIERPLALGMQIGMAITCAVFVALGVRSFIEARRRRRQMENP
jgi:zinc transporter ZupT